MTGPVAATAELAAAAAPAPGAGVGASRSAAAMSPRAGRVFAGGDVRATAALAVTAARALCEAGAGSCGSSRTARGRRATRRRSSRSSPRSAPAARRPALHLSGDADAWLEPVRRLRQAVPCFDPERSPALAGELAAGRRAFGVLAAPGERPHPLADDPSCALVAHDGELAGRIPAQRVKGRREGPEGITRSS